MDSSRAKNLKEVEKQKRKTKKSKNMIFIFNEFLIFKSEIFELNPGKHLFDQLSVIYFLRTEKNYYKNDT